MTIEEAAVKLRAREVSAVELAQDSLRRIHEQQPRLNAFITITEELALAQARRADEELARGEDRGPLHGIPYALKDNFTTRGIRTTCGSKIFADYVPDRDCLVYEKLTAAGAVLTGKTGLHELAYGITSNNPHLGAIRNPRDPERIPGGSSGGSGAAVAGGMVFFAMGSDTGGSIRIPAAFCGCVGLKPTAGLVSTRGMMPLSFTLDHAGPLTRTVRDCALVMKAVADFEMPVEESIAGVRIGVPRNFFNEGVRPAVAEAFADALRKAESFGARLVAIEVPDPAEVNVVGRLILLSEASALMERYMDRRSDFGRDVLALLDQGRLISATDYINALRLRRLCQTRWSKIWDVADVVFTPTVPIEAPLIGQTTIDGEDVRLAATRFVRSFNVLGLPAICAPLSAIKWPASLQILANSGADAELLRIASFFC